MTILSTKNKEGLESRIKGLNNELRLKDEEKYKETKELKSRITELERQNKEIKDMLALRVDINDPELISLKSRCEELTEQVSIFSNNMD
ncbi:hypothetical protein F8M41_002971 [Gigaspora margarita]|uniref:Uncharacterized protein n=1 Tax=Gigaspora margarita TaxID=4874 RepID=A0A8H3XCP7_GIGMA|nr:hypothetical protein F8M41_002971 [Gigaspora margarita]